MTLQNPSPRWHAGRGQVIKADVDASLLPAPAAPSQGKVCAKHPELNGRRWKNGKCPACLREYKQRPDQRAKRRISNRRYRQSPEGRVKVKDRRQKRYRELSPDRYAKLLARNKRYHQSPKGRALLKRYRQSPERRESRRAYMRAYRQKPELKEKHRTYMRVYTRTSEYKEKQRAYRQTPEFKEKRRAYMLAYWQVPENKAKHRARCRARVQKPEVKEKAHARRQTPEYKEKQRVYRQTPEYKAKKRARRQTPEYREKKRAYRQTPEYQEKCRFRPKSDRDLWRGQRKRAALRGIEFLLTFEEWRDWWETNLGSNWRAMRGAKRDHYVMGRINDTGPYALGNIECVLHTDNIRARGARPKKKPNVPIEFRAPDSSEGRAYRNQKRQAARRGIPFLISYKAWEAWWSTNLGPDWFSKRGHKHGQYVMGRIGDVGPYALNNIKCITNAENTREAHTGRRHTPETIAQISATHLARSKVLP